MFRRTRPGHNWSDGSVSVPDSFHNRYLAARANRYSSNNATTGLTFGRERRRRYYGGHSHRDRRPHHRHYWRHSFPKEAEEDEREEKEREEEKEKERLKEEELETLEALLVKKCNFNIRLNAKAHRTSKYHITKGGDEADAVLRRGQEFEIIVKFCRPYNKEKDDLIFVIKADEDMECKNLVERFKLDEDGTGTYKQDKEWGARIVEEGGRKELTIAIYIPPDCVVGEWELNVITATEGDDTEYVHEDPQTLFILFNPWCSDDLTHFTGDKAELEEYVLNDVGGVYSGCANDIGSRPWTYGQFEKDILEISMDILKKAFGFKMTPCMGDPVIVARALSRLVNEARGEGVLVGNWSGNYEGGSRPTSWTNSTDILRQYKQTGQAVKYGQCWVFSHVLTAVSRALGLPCRSITNFDSAHDTDNTCTIDCYYKDGEEVKSMKSDSIWNFHVWNEVWICRPDLGRTYDNEPYDGWHIIDATPQEQSHGAFQCGPCPLAAVKRGEINVGYDTAFVFSEVNAVIVHWCLDEYFELKAQSNVIENEVGCNISTKIPNGKGLKPMNYFRRCDDRLDVTNDYKFPADSKEYKDAIKRAVRFTKHCDKLFKHSQNLKVSFDLTTKTLIGQDFVVTAYVENTTSEDKEVEVLMSCRTCRYWNHKDDDKSLIKETKPKTTIKAGQTETYQVTVSYDMYMKDCDENLCFYAYVCATDVVERMPSSAQNPFRLRRPDLDIEGPESAYAGDSVKVDISFTNPLPKVLTNCRLKFGGCLHVATDDQNQVVPRSENQSEMRTNDVNPGEQFKVTMYLVGDVDPDEDGRCLYMDYDFTCDEFAFCVTGSYSVEMHAK